jgi:putative oxidoreductase
MHASIAERIAYGRPYDPVAADTLVPVVPRSGTALVGRILMAGIFVASGIAKLTDPAAAVGYMNSVGVPNADTLVYVAGLAELTGGLALAFGFLTRIAAIGLVVLLVIINLYFHNFWALAEPEAKTQMGQFMKNLSIMGGLLMVVAMGPGRFSVDYAMRKPKAP